jgi:hypothetical protein
VSDESEALASTGQINVTRAAVMAYMDHQGLQYEEARRQLLELVMGARPKGISDSGLEQWRVRSRTYGLDLSLLVAREGPIASVTHVGIRGVKPRGGKGNR